MKLVSLKSFGVLFVVLLIGCTEIAAQDPLRFSEEVKNIAAREIELDSDKETVVFTGSSSIKMWTGLQERFTSINAINNGFGGSHMSDLLYYLDDLVFQYKPEKVFIYEGDNDISSGKIPEEIMATTEKVISKIKDELPEIEIFIISAKPSISRWDLKENYQELNNLLRKLSERDSSIIYVDVWTPMLEENETLQQDLFLEDDLHMNEKGYKIWREVIEKYLN